jgi:hypothetical protein
MYVNSSIFFKENVMLVHVSPILPLLKMQLKSKVHNVSKKYSNKIHKLVCDVQYRGHSYLQLLF